LKNGQRALIAGQKSGVVHAIDPDQQGKVLWQTRVGHGGSLAGVQWGSAVDADNIYVAVSDVLVEAVPGGAAGGEKPEYGGRNFRLDPNAGAGYTRSSWRPARWSGARHIRAVAVVWL
jgi:polyvinyl alcohol dehydrogenase (cytochrome)